LGCRCVKVHLEKGHNGRDIKPLKRRVDGDNIYSSIYGKVTEVGNDAPNGEKKGEEYILLLRILIIK